MPNALDTLRSLRAIGHRGGALTAFARRFTAAPALFTPDDGDDGASNEPRPARREPQPAEIVRIDVMGHTQYYPVSTGDRKNGYPDMTVAQLSDALDARYAAKKLPAERHVQQLMAKVATAEDASLAAATLARFHHHRAAAFASMNLPRSRHGLTPQSLMMFIGACHRGGNVEAAMNAAENHNAVGLPMTRPALVKLTQLCEDAGQVLRVYELWQKEGLDVDGAIAEAVVIAAARVGEPDAAERWLDEFKAAGIDAFDFSKCEAAVADKRAEMAPPATDDDVNPSDGGEENGGTEEDGHDASQGENESK